MHSRNTITFPEPWPDDISVAFLVKKAGGLFIFASTTCKFISFPSGNPQRLLQKILDMKSGSGYEGTLGLDALYTQVLSDNHKDIAHLLLENPMQFKVILGTIALVLNPLGLKALAILLNIHADDILSFLKLLHSIIRVPPSPSVPITIYHKSFPDYLVDRQRCKDERFHIDSGDHHARLAIACLELMLKELKYNICDLPRYSLNTKVDDLEERRKDCIGETLEYACTAWTQHISQVPGSSETIARILELLNDLMRRHFLSWLEVMGITNNLRTAIYSSRDIKAWLNQVSRCISLCVFFADL